MEHIKGSVDERDVPLIKEAVELIDMARKLQEELGASTDGYIFSMTADPLPYDLVKKAYIRYCESMKTVHKSPHKARKTGITNLIDSGTNVNKIREWVGHQDERTTYRNYYFDPNEEEESNAQLDKALSIS